VSRQYFSNKKGNVSQLFFDLILIESTLQTNTKDDAITKCKINRRMKRTKEQLLESHSKNLHNIEYIL
jgi:hypothetical protein